ncbi:MAG: hypothetical protein LBR94_10140 [Desulfovibrio sp.]|nr:hypothetical protein [Desulfovibrio sp.]
MNSANSRTAAEFFTRLTRFLAFLVPAAYAVLYAPYGMDTTDFGYFYGHPWRILQGEVPYRDFAYITPPVSLYWHAFWLRATPDGISVLAGKISFLAEMLAAAWMGALYLNRVFDLKRLDLPLSLLATAGFVWGVHTFPPMPWHTVDGLFFGSAALLAGICGLAPLAGLFAGLCMLVKQSFLFVPAATAVMVFVCRPKRETIFCLLGTGIVLLVHWLLLRHLNAWEAFCTQTTGQLDMHEALQSGIFIYLTQNPVLPALALVPFIFQRLPRHAKETSGSLPLVLQPVPLYFCLLAAVYVHDTLTQKAWTGYGDSWPTLFMVMGGACVILPGFFLKDVLRERNIQAAGAPLLSASVALGAALLLSWSTGISGGYKIPAFGALPLLFCALLAHRRLRGTNSARACAMLALAAGLAMFRMGYEYPYVFPLRPMPRSSLVHDAGEIYRKARGVYVDAEMFGKLRELRELRLKYGPNYKTLPAFPLAYFLNGDKPAYPAEWLMDWQIGGRVEEFYHQLQERDITVFMEKDQIGVAAPDAYDSRRYSVPSRIVRNWRKIEETRYFVVLQRPNN